MDMEMKSQVTFGVMITTRNRCAELCVTLARLRTLQPSPSEILVCADGCTDDTVVQVAERFPEVRVIINEVGQGSVPSRDRMLRMLATDWVLSLDDDSYPLDGDFFAQAVKLIRSKPTVSVFTFPEQRDGRIYPSPTKTPLTPGHEVSAYPNCAALMNRGDYLKSAGYPIFFFHAYEEPDYALQVYAMDKTVWFEPSLTVRHHLSPKNRSNLRMHQLHSRNELWSVWMRCPALCLPAVTLFRVARQFQHACTQGFSWAVREPLWWIDAVRGLGKCLENRCPIMWQTYFAWMKRARSVPSPSSANH